MSKSRLVTGEAAFGHSIDSLPLVMTSPSSSAVQENPNEISQKSTSTGKVNMKALFGNLDKQRKEAEEAATRAKKKNLSANRGDKVAAALKGRSSKINSDFLLKDEEKVHVPPQPLKRSRFKKLAKTQILLARFRKEMKEPEAERIRRCAEEEESKILRRDESKYFGGEALLRYKATLRRLANQRNNHYVPPRAADADTADVKKPYTGRIELPKRVLSPRSQYVEEVVKSNGLPLPLVLRKDGNPHAVNFAHKGLGDTKIIPILHIIDKLPAVAEINFCDNRLTDESLSMLTTKLERLKMLTHLDLSYNDIDDSAKDIMDYLVSKRCTLKTLVMDGADVDDVECAHIADAMKHNSSIQTLSLSHNKIGEMELLNVVNPDLITGGEGMGDMLMHNVVLTELDLSWNSIRLESAETLADAIAHNKTLEKLRLQHNTFANKGTQRLGAALRVNTSLKTLDLSFNALIPRSAATLAYNLIYNNTLVELNLNGNKLGSVGAQGVVGAMQRSKGEDRTLYISFKDTHSKLHDKTVFNPKEPSGTWEVNLDEPYGRMVMEECVFLANNKAGCKISRLELNNRNIPLEQKEVEEQGDNQRFSSTDFLKKAKDFCRALLVDCNLKMAATVLRPMLQSFRFSIQNDLLSRIIDRIYENWNAKVAKARDRGTMEDMPVLEDVLLMEVFQGLFQIADDDHSGLVTIDELMKIMDEVGVPVDRYKAARIMRDFDVDDSGTIDADEFSMAMIKEFCNMDQPKKTVVEKATGQPWVIPEKGKLKIKMEFECANPASEDIPEEDSIDRIIAAIKGASTPEEREAIFENACRSPYYYLTTQHAQLIFDEIKKHSDNILEIVRPILPQMVNPQHAMRFIDSNFNEAGKLALRVRMGPMYCAYMGNPSGHYTFDLKHIENRIAGQKLAAMSKSMEQLCEHMGVHTSQKGNRTAFRNECLEEQSIRTAPKWWASPPDAGKISFDFASTDRPPEGSRSISDSRMRGLIRKLDLPSIAPLHEILAEKDRIEREKKAAEAAERAKRRERERQAKLAQARKQAKNRQLSSSDLEDLLNSAGGSSRPASRQESGRNSPTGSLADEMSQTDVMSLVGGASVSEVSVGDESAQDSLEAQHLIEESAIPAVLTTGKTREAFCSIMESSHHYFDWYPRERQRDVSRPGYDPDNSRPSTPEDMSHDPPLPHHHKSRFSVIFPYAYFKLLQLQIALPNIFLSVSQVMELLHYFPSDDFMKVQVLVSCFNRIIDIKNIHRIVYDEGVFSMDDRIEAEHRLGILNLFNPMEPNRAFRLDLRRWDHRETAKILVRLAQEEPGDNWVDPTYRWAKYDLPVPGWVLPGPWAQPDPDGPRTHGWLCLTYSSTAPGCQPNMNARRRLRGKVLAGLKKLV